METKWILRDGECFIKPPNLFKEFQKEVSDWEKSDNFESDILRLINLCNRRKNNQLTNPNKNGN